jgi:hypothetical protein
MRSRSKPADPGGKTDWQGGQLKPQEIQALIEWVKWVLRAVGPAGRKAARTTPSAAHDCRASTARKNGIVRDERLKQIRYPVVWGKRRSRNRMRHVAALRGRGA